MDQFTLTVWAKNGPRNQTNCVNGWGRRQVTVDAKDATDAVSKVIALVGRGNYGGLVR